MPELLYEKAATGASDISEPNATANFKADIKRAMDYGQDGQVQALTTPDGRLLALKMESTQTDQVRSILIPRAPEVAKLANNLILEVGTYHASKRTGLRAEPREGPATRSLERGERVESIARVEDTDWRLIGQNGRAMGYLKSDEIQTSGVRSSYRKIDDPKDAVFDVARTKTKCRTAQYALDGGLSGSFTACHAYGGEWVLEHNGDTPPLSPGQYIFRQ